MRTLLFALALCMLVVPVCAAEAPETSIPLVGATGAETDCVYVDWSQSPPQVYTAPC
ncbi:MAG TPA: hypothetical protein VM370_01385 [Candidatus Thermoplasmatota archaeon]|nr:hypothetical protein [Candidatus Thermoplasmatota archaeon]